MLPTCPVFAGPVRNRNAFLLELLSKVCSERWPPPLQYMQTLHETSGPRPVNLFQPPNELPYWPYPSDISFPCTTKDRDLFPVIAYRVCMARTKTSMHLD